MSESPRVLLFRAKHSVESLQIVRQLLDEELGILNAIVKDLEQAHGIEASGTVTTDMLNPDLLPTRAPGPLARRQIRAGSIKKFYPKRPTIMILEALDELGGRATSMALLEKLQESFSDFVPSTMSSTISYLDRLRIVERPDGSAGPVILTEEGRKYLTTDGTELQRMINALRNDMREAQHAREDGLAS